MSSGFSYRLPMNQAQVYPHRESTKRRWCLAAGALGMVGPGRRRLLLLAPAVISLAVATAACGSGPSKTGSASLRPTTTAVPVSAAAAGGPPPGRELVEYARCMRSHGAVNFPDDPASPAGASTLRALKQSGGMSSPQFQAAAQACEKYAPRHSSAPQITAQDQADYLRAALCMRNHGIAGFPDPVFSGGQVDFPIPQSMNTNSTQFRRAREICEMLIPAGLPYSKEAEGGQ